MVPRGGGGDEGDEEDRGVEGGETPSVLGGFAQLTIAPAPLEEDRVNLNAPLHHGTLHITMVPPQECRLNLSALPQHNTPPRRDTYKDKDFDLETQTDLALFWQQMFDDTLTTRR